MAEDPQPMTLQQRIASLNAAHISRIPGDAPLLKAKPQVPMKRPVVVQRQKTVNNPPENVNGSVISSTKINQPNGLRQNGVKPPPPLAHAAASVAFQNKAAPPPLPTRQPSVPPPPLPSRRPSEQSVRRDSTESMSSATSKVSTYSNGTGLSTLTRAKSNERTGRVKAPAWGEAELPPIRGFTPERKYSSEKPKYEIRAPSAERRINPGKEDVPPVPKLPPRLPQRNVSTAPTIPLQPAQNGDMSPKTTSIPLASLIDKAKRSALSFDMSKENSGTDQVINLTRNGVLPPPVPLASRPDLAALQATRPRSSTPVQSTTHEISDQSSVCLICRDFSAPDYQATFFPRQHVQSLQQLAEDLTSSFPSPTDKARAIFTWLHHNIRYDVNSFFTNNVKPSNPQSTLSTGLAVCEGYAALFTNLATHAGLESVVISGHGKGFGYHPLAPGSPIPPYNAGHAWNAVRIDNDEWKLIDACWGAGHVQGANQPYIQEFHSHYFTMSNEEFAVKHFPDNKDMFFLPQGQRMSWEEYIQINPASWPLTVEPPTVFSNAGPDFGIGDRTVLPRSRKISPYQQGKVRFQFSLHCPHWTVERTGKGLPPVFVLAINGLDGRNKDFIPLEHIRSRGGGGEGGENFWFCELEARELGAPGQAVTLFAVSSFGDRQDARGLSVREFREGKGRVGMGFQGIAAWDLV